MSDLFLAIPKKGYSGLWIELKSLKGKLSEQQRNWLDCMRKAGYKTATIRSLDDAINIITIYLK